MNTIKVHVVASLFLLVTGSAEQLQAQIIGRPDSMSRTSTAPARYLSLEKIDRFRRDQNDRVGLPASESDIYATEPKGMAVSPMDLSEAKADKNVQERKKKTLLSDGALDRFFANQTVRYLTGKNDLSYYNTYFTASSGDGSFNVGHTITQKDRNDDERVLSVTNVGFKTNLLNGLGSLYSGRAWNREVGLFINQTWLRQGRIWFYPKYKPEMDYQRAYLRRKIESEQNQKAIAFLQRQQDALVNFDSARRKQLPIFQFKLDSTDFRTRMTKDSLTFFGQLDKDFFAQYLEQEVASGKKFINYAFKDWFTMRGSVAGQSHQVLDGAAAEVKNRNFVPYRLSADYVFYAEDFRETTAYRLLVTTSVSLFNTNQVRILDRYGKDAASKLGGKRVTKDGETYWEGDFSTITQGSVWVQGLLTLPHLAPKWSKAVSLDLFGELGIGRYSAHDVGAGLLFTLAAQDKETPVNVEILCRFVDVSRNLLPGKDALDRLQIGLSLALPIDGTLNKLK